MTPPRRAPGGFPVVGIIGGGQLARMCQPPAVGLAVTLSVLAESPTAAAALVVPSAPVGSHTDVETVCRFARDCDVVTFDHEHVPGPVLAALVADGAVLHPSPQALLFAQDKLAMRQRLTALGVPCPRWTLATSPVEVVAFAERVGWPVVAKKARGGYDGKGVRVLASAQEAEQSTAGWFAPSPSPELSERGGAPGRPGSDNAVGVLVEERVDFVRELAVLVARSPSGQAVAWQVVETVQSDGICTEVLAPAPDLGPERSARMVATALRIAGELGVTGVMAVEAFDLGPRADDPGFLINELAMRPHNSGHWTIDGAVTSQFEQHLRAVLDLPLGDPSPRSSWTVMGNVLGGEHPQLYPAYRHLLARDPGLRLHLYGKDVRAGRKIGHVNVCGEDLADLRARAEHACDYLRGVVTQ
ncbi:MAG TPA: 5-(carboxyamino)imidazole ribonucleotide synthase [Dermatophilaceae bacterium]|nr:5-(carboxyamino)imidazole ribonucleotide synthase [Dermatophilaceae bacterium]